MNYLEFKKQLQDLPVIQSRDLVRFQNDAQAFRNQLNRWEKRGLIIKLKRGFYLLNENDRKINPSRQFIANQLYSPSYVSLEYALSMYGLIPERVIDLTSVATKKTMRIKNKLGNFIYQHVKTSAFRGFRMEKDSVGQTYFIAVAEKAVVDFLYFNLYRIKVGATDVFSESFRFQNVDSLKQNKLVELAKLFSNRKLKRVVNDFCRFIKKEGAR